MIDAYEIGIKLALQDDVTSGLAVIERELAEMDRAIAVTNAALHQLERDAAQVRTSVPNGAKKDGKQDSAPEEPSVPVSASATLGPAKTEVSPSPTTGAEPTRPSREEPVKATLASPELQRPLAREAQPMPPIGSIAEEASTAPVAVLPTPATPPALAVRPDERTGERAEAPVNVVLNVQRPAVRNVPEARQVAPVRAAALPAADVSGSTTATTDISSSVFAALPVRQDEAFAPTPALATRHLLSQRRLSGERQDEGDRLLVPVPNGRASTGQRSGGLTQERSAAPAPAPTEQGAAGGGTVTLDGRLVGYWLSEVMARDAARPPSGTTSFDPRQSPAWTVSGVL